MLLACERSDVKELAGAFISRVSGDAALARNFAASVFVPLPVLIRSHAVFLLEPAVKNIRAGKIDHFDDSENRNLCVFQLIGGSRKPRLDHILIGRYADIPAPFLIKLSVVQVILPGQGVKIGILRTMVFQP